MRCSSVVDEIGFLSALLLDLLYQRDQFPTGRGVALPQADGNPGRGGQVYVDDDAVRPEGIPRWFAHRVSKPDLGPASEPLRLSV